MRDVIARKTPGGFAVVDDHGERVLQRIPNDALVLITPHIPRNIEWLKKYMLLIDRLFACGLEDRYKSPTLLRKAILLHGGFTEPQIDLVTGVVTRVALSMAIEEMDQQTFADCWDKTIDIIITEIIPTLDAHAFEIEIDKVLELVDGDRRAA